MIWSMRVVFSVDDRCSLSVQVCRAAVVYTNVRDIPVVRATVNRRPVSTSGRVLLPPPRRLCFRRCLFVC